MKDELILSIRGGAIGSITPESSSEEKFQNQTLRPILKTQNDLLLAVFKNYIAKQKIDFKVFTPEKKMLFIENAIQRDIKFRNSLKGMIIGFFTLLEYEEYILNSSNLNKRMMNLLIERYKSQIQII